MNQRPRLGVKHAAFVTLVVFRRIVIDGEQLAQRKQFLFPQRHQVIRDEIAEMNLAILLDVESAIILSKTFVEPRRHVWRGVIDQQVNILVIDDAEGTVGISLGA